VRVGFHSPLPPAQTGVADYSAALLAALRNHGQVEPEAQTAGVHLYHVGNNQLHREIYWRAIERPGVVVLHDAVLQHFFLGSLDRAAYIEEFVYNYGEWNRELAAQLWASRARSGAEESYFRYPMLRRIAEVSRALVVHNPAAARIVRRHAPNARVEEIPHLFVPPPDGVELSSKTEILTFAVIGFLRETKRLHVIVKAFDEVIACGIDATLLVAGQFTSPDLERAMRPLLRRADVRQVGWTCELDFWRMTQTVDVGINLRYPAAGETSGIAIRLMGSAKPVILTEGEEISRFPPETCLRVAPGIAEQPELVQYMLMLAQSPGLREEMGRLAAAHIERNHSAKAVAAAYWNVLCTCCD
jgi:glycosyltransferase involved in cell wall biosynthesis